MKSKTDYSFQISGTPCIIRNVPCWNHHGAISFDVHTVGVIAIIREKMLFKEIPYDIEFEHFNNTL